MINLELSKEQKRLTEKTREIVQAEIVPHALFMDQAGDDSFDWRLARALSRHNLLCPTIPKEFGGLGLSHLSAALVMEEIAAGCAGVAAVIDANMHAASPIILAGNRYQQETFLPGMTGPDAHIAAFALTEPDAGSDIGSVAAFARPTGKGYTLTGRKDYVLNASAAHFFSVFASTEQSRERASLRAFLVPAASDGLSLGEIRHKVGIKYANTSGVSFNGVLVPEDHVVGGDRAGSGYLLLMQTFDRGRALVGATAVGVARAAYEMALNHARERQQFGKPIIRHQAIAFTLAEMATKIEMARLLTWKACCLIDRDQDYTAASSMAKLAASQIAQEVTCAAGDILASRGYMAHSLADKLIRDARGLSTIEGTTNVQKVIIASLL